MLQPIVTIEDGRLKGKICFDYKGREFFTFYGIPYAKPPVGDLRFKAPQPAENWVGIRDATVEASECPAHHFYFNTNIGSEEKCLHLNVFTKDISQKHEKRPVMVWIHGGGFVAGSNKTFLYGPGFLMSEDIVLVSINYRLGVFGFLSLEDETLGVPGNAGLKDIILALKWVQKNITVFGGDPNNVTVFGQSAGGAAVHYLLFSPLSSGLFHKAIMQSGVSSNGWARGTRNALVIANYLGYKETEENKILEKLKKETTDNILIALRKFRDTFYASSVRHFGPVIENTTIESAFISKKPLDILKSGNFIKVPVVVGYVSNEGSLWELLRKGIDYSRKVTANCEKDVPYDLYLEKGSAQLKTVERCIREFYYKDEVPSEENIENTYKMNGDINFLYGINKAIHQLANYTDQPIYVYKISLDGPLNFFKKICFVTNIIAYFGILMLTLPFGYNSYARYIVHLFANLVPVKPIEGAAHGDEIGYLFQQSFSPKIIENSIEHVYVRRFVKLWTNFAYYGHPTPSTVKEKDPLHGFNWPRWNNVEKQYVEIGTELVQKTNPDEKTIEFWDSIYKKFGK